MSVRELIELLINLTGKGTKSFQFCKVGGMKRARFRAVRGKVFKFFLTMMGYFWRMKIWMGQPQKSKW